MRGTKPVIGMLSSPAPSEGLPLRHRTNTAYIEAIRMAGGIPLQIPIGPPEEAAAYVELLDGLLVPGGEDIAPCLLGEDALPEVTYTYLEKDVFEIALVRAAEAKGLPIFGICRGIQLLNVVFGGTLYQDMARQCGKNICHNQNRSIRDALSHRVTVEEGSLLGKLLGEGEIWVNSYHHQALNRVAKGFRVTAVAADGIIEGFERADGRVYGVQWHPEEMVVRYPQFLSLFRHLVELSAGGKKKVLF